LAELQAKWPMQTTSSVCYSPITNKSSSNVLNEIKINFDCKNTISIANPPAKTMIFLTRRERFSAAHRLYNPDWTDEKNASVYGKCSNPNWHGHNYELFVTVKGEINPGIGFVIDLKQLGEIIRELVIDKIDHKNLNLDVDFMQGKMASTELIAIAIWEQLEAPVISMGAQLHSVRLCETENNYVEYFGK
jgi:6-pyruvoyltetrahydropterin/6-carboxytetrahydropterin synthase